MPVRQVQQVPGAQQLDPSDAYQIDGQQRGHGSKRERADDAVAQRLLLVALRQPKHEHGEDHRVVGTEETFERDEEGDCEEVGRRDHELPEYCGNVDTDRIKAYTWRASRLSASRPCRISSSSASRRACSACTRRLFASTSALG